MADEGTATCSIEIDTTRKEATHADEGTDTFIQILVAILLPFLGVYLKFGYEDEFWICLLLTFFCYLPGLIYALYVIIE
ncbi:hypothetical protein RGQ29_024962 [Quercus rubra]|uniref:Uncharacterized protein n=1 Tax=Quercus rubra TaxID=3512 RepID=A0AAN7EWJ5_QUERU|nr:hypothetical protein RGQ29_024962 [Quercus rubra]